MKKFLVMLLTILLISSMVACASQKAESIASPGVSSGPVADTAQGAPTATEAVPTPSKDGSILPELSNGFALGSTQKIIFRSDMMLETENFDETLKKIDAKVKETNSYYESSNISGDIRYAEDLRYASLIIRVPANRFEEMKKEAVNWGHMISSNTSSQDVTKQYIDTEARLKALKIQEERLLALLSKAVKLDDIILLESRLSDVRYQIENYTGSLSELDALVDYATIALNVQEVKTVTVNPENFGQKLFEAFKDSMRQIGKLAEGGLIALIYLIPYIIIIIIILLIIKKSGILTKKNQKSENDEERKK